MKLNRLIMIALGVTTLSMMVLVGKMAVLSAQPPMVQGLTSQTQRVSHQLASLQDGDIPKPPVYDMSRNAVVPRRGSSASLAAYGQSIIEANAALLASSGGRPSQITFVTAIWDIGRGSMKTSDQWNVLRRPFSHYIAGAKQFLAYRFPKVVFCDLETYARLKPLIDEATADGAGETRVVIKSLDELASEFSAFDAVTRLRESDAWLDQSAWIRDSPQAQLPMYIPIVMSKLSLTRDAARWNPFGTDSFRWMDGAHVV